MKAEDHQKEVLKDIGKAYNKTGAQVLLKYQVERGVVVIPKSHNRENQAVNLDLFDFQLTAADGSSLTGTMVNLFVGIRIAPPLNDTYIEVPDLLYALFDYGLIALYIDLVIPLPPKRIIILH